MLVIPTIKRRPRVMLYAAIDIHKRLFQAAVLESETGEVSQERFAAERSALDDWAMRWQGKVVAVGVEATTGWRWVVASLQGHGFDVRLIDPGQARALQGRQRRAKTDRLDARWLALLLSRQLAPAAWIPPAEIRRLRDQTRLRKALSDERRRWAQRLHALLLQEGWPCARGRLLTGEGQRWLQALQLAPEARAYVDSVLAVMAALEAQLQALESELRRFARSDRRCQALQTIYGVGPILASHLLAEIGDVGRFRHARQLVRAAGLDPVVEESGERRRRGKLSKQGSPHLRWALVEAAQHGHRLTSPDRPLQQTVAARAGGGRAKLTIARKIARRAFHLLQAEAA
jgi:transposase